MNSYYVADESMDPRLLRNRAHPQLVHILNKEYCDLMIERNGNFSIESSKALSSIQKDLFSHFDFDFKGKMDYKGAQDYMDVWPKFRGCFGVINERIKTIFEELNISKEEYILHPIDIEGCCEMYYIMFVYQIPITNIVLKKSVYCHSFHPEVEYKLNNHNQYYDGEFECIIPKHLVIGKEFSNYDIIRIQSCSDTFFSERLVHKIMENNVIGLQFYPSGRHAYDKMPFLSNTIPSLSFE